jgi:hypothetical protein
LSNFLKKFKRSSCRRSGRGGSRDRTGVSFLGMVGAAGGEWAAGLPGPSWVRAGGVDVGRVLEGREGGGGGEVAGGQRPGGTREASRAWQPSRRLHFD